MKPRILLVGDNPFHGISHLSQERSRSRVKMIDDVDYDTELVRLSLENGATGFMFSVSEKTLAILKKLRQKTADTPRLYAIVPYTYEYVRLATQMGITGLAKKVVAQMVHSTNIKGAVLGMKGVVLSDPEALFKTYLHYEVSRIRSAAGHHSRLESVMLHEVITEMALALNLRDLVKSYIDFMGKQDIMPGFETRNFPYLVDKFRAWDIDFSTIAVATPFNKAGFQMNPSKIECEKALRDLGDSSIIAMNILASGYLPPAEGIDYLHSLPNLAGVVIGVSKEHHAKETFQLLHKHFGDEQVPSTRSDYS